MGSKRIAANNLNLQGEITINLLSKNENVGKLNSLNRTAKRANLSKKALACAMSILTLCPSVSVSVQTKHQKKLKYSQA